MNIGLSEAGIKSIVQAFSDKTIDVLNEAGELYGLNETGNFKNFGSWDLIFNRIKNAALLHDLIVIKKKRGNWKFIIILDDETGTLLVFTKEKNIEKVIKDFGKENIHYFHAFVGMNPNPIELADRQLQLFPIITNEYEEKRIAEAQKILGEDYSSVNQVIFITAKEERKEIISVEARLYSPYFELLDRNDWSQYITEKQYSDVLNVFDDETVDNDDEIGTIPKVRKEIQDSKKLTEERIPSQKQKQHEDKEEDNS
ncbi:DUF5986 family protein [Bacillus norwichensis]|uniref:Uncharacterized protein n=1 Tax=Bacillus norwichensis TaxID=2762217 RepID=A0ABR8VSR2_9BACI|nr:DUF5986 family protein [Bacillus norwichensis]MBD8007446.1 hypothetical protein [Bacillus norwichensis]